MELNTLVAVHQGYGFISIGEFVGRDNGVLKISVKGANDEGIKMDNTIHVPECEKEGYCLVNSDEFGDWRKRIKENKRF